MRPLRLLIPNAIYHVSARVTHKKDLLAQPEAKKLFLKTVLDAGKKYSFELHNYVIMETHIHMLIQPLENNSLSMIMKWILGVYAMRFNRLFSLWGGLWGDRFFSRPIRNSLDYMAIYYYINENPVRANLVKKAIDWPWGTKLLLRQGFYYFIQNLPLSILTWVTIIFTLTTDINVCNQTTKQKPLSG